MSIVNVFDLVPPASRTLAILLINKTVLVDRKPGTSGARPLPPVTHDKRSKENDQKQQAATANKDEAFGTATVGVIAHHSNNRHQKEN
jgi:hypothetical protein